MEMFVLSPLLFKCSLENPAGKAFEKDTWKFIKKKCLSFVVFFLFKEVEEEEEAFLKKRNHEKICGTKGFQLVLISSSPFSLFLLCCEFALLSRK